jgi:TadE-like protein
MKRPLFDSVRANLGRLRSDQAAEIAEAAVILPVLFMLLFSIYWFGRAYMIYGAINHAAREGAQTAAVPACANCNGSCTWPGTALPCDATVVQAVNDSLRAANLDPTQAIPSTPSPTPQPCPGVVPEGVCSQASGGQFTICRNMRLNQGASSPPVCGVIVSFQYPYQFVLPFTSLNNQRIQLKAQVEMRGED